jgi:uncharacterized membrane protein YkgB
VLGEMRQSKFMDRTRIENQSLEEENEKNSKRQNWTQIVEAIKTPLGFFVLSVLLVEAFLTGIFAIASEEQRTIALLGILCIAAFLIFIVTSFAFFKPDRLFISQTEKL